MVDIRGRRGGSRCPKASVPKEAHADATCLTNRDGGEQLGFCDRSAVCLFRVAPLAPSRGSPQRPRRSRVNTTESNIKYGGLPENLAVLHCGTEDFSSDTAPLQHPLVSDGQDFSGDLKVGVVVNQGYVMGACEGGDQQICHPDSAMTTGAG